MSLKTVCQVWVAVCGMSAVWLLSYKDRRVRRWGYVVGLLSQPGWLISAVLAEQWGIALLTIWYTLSYVRGMVQHFKRESNELQQVRHHLAAEVRYSHAPQCPRDAH
jgi:hypothetical protein